MVPQWLKLAFGVKRALAVLLAFEKNGGSSALIWNVCIHDVIRNLSSSPYSAWPAQRRRPANETRPCERHMCVCEYTHCNASVSCRFFDVSCISATRL